MDLEVAFTSWGVKAGRELEGPSNPSILQITLEASNSMNVGFVNPDFSRKKFRHMDLIFSKKLLLYDTLIIYTESKNLSEIDMLIEKANQPAQADCLLMEQ